jgi:hypothetical protein
MRATPRFARPFGAASGHYLGFSVTAIALILVSVLLQAYVSAAAPRRATPGAQAPAPAPPCGRKLTALSKSARGRADQGEITTICSNPATEQICNLRIKFDLQAGKCDEARSLTGTLFADVTVVRRRSDARGCFTGQWQLIGQRGAVIAAGDLSGTVGAGTHRQPATSDCEPCSVPRHYEGKLTGQVLGADQNEHAEICATIAGNGPLQPRTDQQIAIEGVVITPCHG